MKVLIAGMGSIGQRHARNLRTLVPEVELLAYRRRGLPDVITEQMTIEPGTIGEKYHVRVFDDLDQALLARPDAVLVCNPTSEHISTALAAVRAGCHVFIEKPLSHRLDQVDELIELAERSRRVAAVGYQMRCHPALRRARELLAGGAIGRLLSIRAEMGEYLPDAHPYEDYRTSYAARADLGGGVILCYIHEFDYIYWLAGMPTRVFTVGGRLGDLEIDVEDTALTTMECRVDGRPVAVQVHHSFLQRPPSRTCEIVGDAGVIRVDLRASTLQLSSAAGPSEVMTFEGFERNQLFLDELRQFLAAIAGQGAPIASARDAAHSLRMALAAKASLASGQAVELA